mgnify:CR=1 FL=1
MLKMIQKPYFCSTYQIKYGFKNTIAHGTSK